MKLAVQIWWNTVTLSKLIYCMQWKVKLPKVVRLYKYAWYKSALKIPLPTYNIDKTLNVWKRLLCCLLTPILTSILKVCWSNTCSTQYKNCNLYRRGMTLVQGRNTGVMDKIVGSTYISSKSKLQTHGLSQDLYITCFFVQVFRKVMTRANLGYMMSLVIWS